jgi:hypothetical protein
LRPLRELAPALDTFAMVPPVGISDLHMDPPDPAPHVSDHQLLGAMPATAIDELVAVAGPGSGSPLVSVELRHTGGALARSAPHHGALSTLPGSFAMFALGVPMGPDEAAAIRAQLGLVTRALAPYDVGRYSNFTVERLAPARFYPDDLFRANHAIPSGR